MNEFPADHDLHAHTTLSACCHDPAQTADALARHALARGYGALCVTNHVWDQDVPGASAWYRPQDIAHVRSLLPLPRVPASLLMMFGCETEFCGGDRLGLRPDHFAAFDFVIIPPNHFNMPGFVRPEGVDAPEDRARLLVERLEEIARLPIPFYKVGIAHLTTGLLHQGGDKYAVIDAVPEARFYDAMRAFAKNGAGIELNAACFAPGWQARADMELKLYRIARQAGCRFYLGSDAHSADRLDGIQGVLPDVIRALALTAEDRYQPPAPGV